VIEVIFLAGAEADVQALYEERESFREKAAPLRSWSLAANRFPMRPLQRFFWSDRGLT
jgi:hypothetical protein